MKVLITGATGLVGKAIVKELHSSGVQVNYLTTKKDKIVTNEDYHGYYWNPKTSEIDEACFENVSAIINLAGASISKKWTKRYKAEVLNSRLNSLKTLKKGIQNASPKIVAFVSASAIGVYPSSLSTLYVEDEKQIV